LYKKGEYKPYTYEELLKVMTEIMPMTPRYCRLTRIVRDIPSTDIVAGNKLTNFRQIAELELERTEKKCQCIRCREIKGKSIREEDLELEKIEYMTEVGKEIFLSFKTKSEDKIIGFLRLSLPKKLLVKNHFIEELRDSAMIREVHVYGSVVDVGIKQSQKSQHLGIGTKLVKLAEKLASEDKYHKISVISAIGTREYYKKLGFVLGKLYMVKNI